MRRGCVALIVALVAAQGAQTGFARPRPCVGNPPRQAEDPLSPPCVPGFDGDNGGTTDAGTTRTHLQLVVYNTLGLRGEMNARSEGLDAQLPRTVKAYVRHFASRYQTYGRTISAIAVPARSDRACRSEAASVISRHRPFAVIALGDVHPCVTSEIAARFDRPVFTFTGPGASVQRAHRGRLWSFLPHLADDHALATAGFICRALAGRPARFTTDPTLRDTTRRFGLAYPSRSARGDEAEDLAARLLRHARAHCGLREGVDILTETYVDDATAEAPSFLNRWKRAGVTTVICYCVPQQTENTVAKMQVAANGLGYQPEWYWDSAGGMDDPQHHRGTLDRSLSSFGITQGWRRPAPRDTHHHAAYLDQEPGTTPDPRWSSPVYHTLLIAFSGIQLAGPRLTAERLERGLRTHERRLRRNPFVPQASFAADDAFVESFMAWWWDPTGEPPGGRAGEGCRRLMRAGTGYAARTWPRGDDALFVAGAPCDGREPWTL